MTVVKFISLVTIATALACSSPQTGDCVSGDLEVNLTWTGPSECDQFPGDFQSVSIDVHIDGLDLYKTDAKSETRDQFVFDLPDSISSGTSGTITFEASGDPAGHASGSADFVDSLNNCSVVAMTVTCTGSTIDAGVDAE